MAKSYLFYVQDEAGREIAHWRGEVERVTEVTADLAGGEVRLQRNDVTLATGTDPGGQLALYRVPADDKLAEPVRHPVKRDDETD
jgi:hypothetical protein